MGFISFIKNIVSKPISKIDSTRELVENLIADAIEKLQGNETIDNGERTLTVIILTAVEAKTGITIPTSIKTDIEDGVVAGLNKGNIALVKQLRK